MIRRALLTLTIIGSVVGAQASRPLIGVLEYPECEQPSQLAVRPLFVRDDSAWVPLIVTKTQRATAVTREWTVAFNGRRLGSIAVLPRLDTTNGSPERSVLRLARGQRVPSVGGRTRQFVGWCQEPKPRPLVVVTPANVSDPEAWKPFVPPATLRAQLLPAFRQLVDRAVRCPGGSEKPVHFNYSANDLRIAHGYRSRSGRTIVAVELDQRRYECDGPPGDDWANHWFVLDDQPRPLGVGLELVDAGDYDGDGNSELLFWYSGDNVDGYSLFSDRLAHRVDRWWSYH